jgi:hypothetical protein
MVKYALLLLALALVAAKCSNYRDGLLDSETSYYGSPVNLSVSNTETAGNARIFARLIDVNQKIYTGTVACNYSFGCTDQLAGGSINTRFDRVSFYTYSFVSQTRSFYPYIPDGSYLLVFFASNTSSYSSVRDGVTSPTHFAKKLVTVNSFGSSVTTTFLYVGDSDIAPVSTGFNLNISGLASYNGQQISCSPQYTEISATPLYDRSGNITENSVKLTTTIAGGAANMSSGANKHPLGTFHYLCEIGSSVGYMTLGNTYFTIANQTVTNGATLTPVASGFATIQ